MTTLRNIQSLRAAAAYAVVLHHLIDAVDFFVAEGRYGLHPTVFSSGVDVFFVLSGFIMAHTTRGVGPLKFAAARVARVAPSYWLLTVFVVVVHALGSNLFGHRDNTLADVLRSLFFLPRFDEAGAVILPVLYVGWTLNYEMLFYALFAATLRMRGRASGHALLIASVSGLVLVGARASNPYLVYWGDAIILEFAAGIVTWHLWQRAPLSSTWSYLLGAGAIALLVLTELWASSLPRVLVWGVPATMLVYASACLESAGSVVRSAGLVAQGNASYAVYLLHPLLLRIVGKCFLLAGLTETHLGIVLYGVTSLVVVGCTAYVFHRWIEAPLTRGAQRLLGVRAPRAAAPDSLATSSRA